MAANVGLPQGFVLDAPMQSAPSLPDGFVLDVEAPKAAPETSFGDMTPRDVVRNAAMGRIPRAEAEAYLRSVALDPAMIDRFGQEPQGKLDERLGAATQLVQGYTANFGDEIGARVGAPIVAGISQVKGAITGEPSMTKDAAREALQRDIRERADIFAKQNPVRSAALNVAGGVANPLLRVAGGGSGLLARAATGSVVGGGYGAAYGYGEGEGVQSRMEKAQDYGTAGAALGAALPVAIAGVAGGGKIAGKAGAVAKRTIVGGQADDILSDIVKRSDQTPEQLRSALRQGEISTLADVGGDEVRGLTRAVGKTAGGRNVVADALEGRSEEAVRRVSNLLSRKISDVDTFFGNLDDVVKARSKIAEPLYKKAYQEGAEIADPRLNKFLADKRVVEAENTARQMYGVRLEAPRNSVENLDGVKKVLDDQIGTALRNDQRNLAGSLLELKNGIVDVLDSAAPSYKKARKVFSDFSQIKSAQEAGLEFSKQTPEQIQRYVSKLSPDQLDAYRIGVRENLQRVVNKTGDGADPAKRIFGNAQKREQLKAVFGDGKAYGDFTKRLREEINAAETKFKVLGGSRTDFNLDADAEFASTLQQAAQRGVLGTVTDKAIGYVTNAIARRYYGLNETNAKAIARALVDREEGLKALDKIIQRQAPKQRAEMQAAVTSMLRDQPEGEAKNLLQKIKEQVDQSTKAVGAGAKKVGKALEGKNTGAIGDLRRLPAGENLNLPRIPTALELEKFGKQQNAPLSMMRAGQNKMEWDKFNKGLYQKELIKGYGDKPVVVKMNNGEYVVMDGHHRIVNELNKGKKEMPMHVIEANDYDPVNSWRKSVNSPEMSDEQLLRELGVLDDLPMDTASRMQRARELGFDVDNPVYHGTDATFDAFDLSKTGENTLNQGFIGHGVYVSPNTKEAAQYGKNVMPLYVKKGKVLDLRTATHEEIAKALPSLKMENGKSWAEQFVEKRKIAEGITDINVQPSSERQGFVDVFYKDNGKLKKVYKYVSPLEVKQDGGKSVALADAMMERNFKDPDNVGPIGKYFGSSEVTEAAKKEGFIGIKSHGTNITSVGDEMVVFDPKNIRSVHAKFDPKKSNSANLTAGIGALGLAGMYANQERFNKGSR